MSFNKYAQQIEKALQSYESYHPWHEHSLEWICNRIDWCWKWRKISQNEMEDFCIRVCNLLDEK